MPEIRENLSRASRVKVWTFLRLEGLTFAAAALWAYVQTGGGWQMFLLLVLLPDLAMLGYLLGPRAGALAYNLAHTYALPLSLAALAHLLGSDIATSAGLVWIFHIGLDRLLGYGLKHDEGFRRTHLGP